ncbi:LOW QUALITY PROTEIN: odorant receptor 13a-like, partial [Vespula squamosa]
LSMKCLFILVINTIDLMTYIKNFRYVIANIIENMLVLMRNKAVSEAVQYKKLCIRLYTRIFTYNNDHFRLLGNSLLLRFYQFSSYRSIDHIEVQSQECFEYYRRSSPRNPKNNSRTSSIDKKNLLIEIFVFNFERYKCVERYEISEADEKDVIIKNNLSSSHLLADLFEDSFNIVIGQHLFRTTILLCIPRYRMLSSLAVIETEGIITFSCDELYFCDWCELPTMDMKSIWICMMRCSKHLRLTCAKFCILYVWSHIGIKNLYTGYRFIGQSNIILSEIHFKFAILRTKITFKPPILYYIISSKDRYHHPEGDNVEQTIARLFWNLTIGISRLVVPTIFILRICLH